MTKKYNWGLPEGFVLDWDIISHREVLSLEGKAPLINDIYEGFDRYVNEEQIDVNCRTLAKVYNNLPVEPYQYRLSLIVFRVLSQQDFDRLQKTYPDKYKSIEFKGTIEEGLYNSLIKYELIESVEWREVIEAAIQANFKPDKYERPIPVLTKYGWCGFLMDKAEGPWSYTKKGELELRRNGDWYEHTPWMDEAYHKVVCNAPLRVQNNLMMIDFLLSVMTKVNDYFQDQFFTDEELNAVWDSIRKIDSVIKQHGVANIEAIKKIFNPKIEHYNQKGNFTPSNAFFMRHIVDYLDELQDKKLLKRCAFCYKAFDYKEKREYCTEQCRRSKNRRLDYYKHIIKRREKSRIEMQDTREFYKQRGISK